VQQKTVKWIVFGTAAVIGLAFFFNVIIIQQVQETALETYLEGMSDQLLDKESPLRYSNHGEPTRELAQTQTLNVLRKLDVDRRNRVFQFLRDSKLLGVPVGAPGEGEDKNTDTSALPRKKAIALLKGADMREMELSRAKLAGANLTGTNFAGANLSGTYLTNANLIGVDLSGANLSGTYITGGDLTNANLAAARLYGTYLTNANLTNVNLTAAKLDGAHLLGAILSGANLRDAKGFTCVNFETAIGQPLALAYDFHKSC